MNAKVALFAANGSEQIADLAQCVSEDGGEPIVLDIQVGGVRGNTLGIGGDIVRWQGVDLADVKAVHIRCTAPRTLPCLPPVINAASHAEYRAGFLREQEFNAATFAFFDQLAARGVLIVNRLTEGYIDHDSKAQFYAKLRAWGFAAPRTLTTTDVGRAVTFVDSVGEAVVKPAIGVGSTRLVTGPDRERLADDLPHCPALFQERAAGDTIRVHIVGDTVVLALRILTDGGVDSRTATKGFEPMRLPEAEEHRLVACNRKLGLHYAAWDVILGADGRVSYLDCNPGPSLMWIGTEYRRAVLRQLGRYLITYARTESIAAAAAAVGTVPVPGSPFVAAAATGPSGAASAPEAAPDPSVGARPADTGEEAARPETPETPCARQPGETGRFRGRLAVAGHTVIGPGRRTNQDSWRVDAEQGLLLVADGMGGHADGEVASRMAVDVIPDFIYEYDEETVGVLVGSDGSDVDEAIIASALVRAAVTMANQRIFGANEAPRARPARPMGTTIVGLRLLDSRNSVVAFHVGDSRLYRVRAGEAFLLTKDHSLIQQWRDMPVKHTPPPQSNIVLRALGPAANVIVDVQTVDFAPGDTFVLCTDGLCSVLDDITIAATVAGCGPDGLITAAERLAGLARERGSRDDITVVVARCL